jgi:drug/metabolite transporter (DMT)-like permease
VHLGIAVLCLIWGSTWLVISEGLRDLPPFTSLAARFLLAGGLFAAVAGPLARVEGGARPSRKLVTIHGLGTMALPYAVIYWVETRLPSGLVSVLWSIYPILLALTAHAFLPDERMRGRQWAGLAVGFLGVTSMFWTDVRELGPAAVPAGLLLLLSPLSTALATPFIKRGGAGTSSILLNRNGTLVGALGVAALALAVERDAPLELTGPAVFSVAYLAIVGTVLAFGIYYWLLRHAAAMHLAMIAFAVPAVALALGAFVGGEPVGPHTILGMVLILVGVGLVLLGKRRVPEPAGR